MLAHSLLVEGWSVCPKAAASGRHQLLDQDLKTIGVGALPADHGPATGFIPGPHVLQLVSVADVGQPTRAAAATADSNKQRILRLRLTDGVTNITCIEVRHVSALSPDLVPGTKLRLSQVPVRAGVVLLKHENVEVLGGNVAELHDAWEFNRKFAGITRAAASKDDNESAPAFCHFAPGRRGKGRPPHSTRIGGLAAAAADAGLASQADSTSAIGPETQRQIASGQGPVSPAQQAPRPAATLSEQWQGAAAVAADIPAAAPAPLEGQAKQRLLERLAREDHSSAGRGRGRGRGRRAKDDDADDGSITLEEYEARRRSAAAGPAEQLQSDEALARQLQQELDLQEGSGSHLGQQQPAGTGSRQRPRPVAKSLSKPRNGGAQIGNSHSSRAVAPGVAGQGRQPPGQARARFKKQGK